jgi:hypothetical protein
MSMAQAHHALPPAGLVATQMFFASSSKNIITVIVQKLNRMRFFDGTRIVIAAVTIPSSFFGAFKKLKTKRMTVQHMFFVCALTKE